MTAEELWEKLHENPELSNEEHRTKEILRQFLSEETDAAVRDGSAYVTALHEESAPETIAVRADMDAIPRPDGTPFHGCGHDGHMAMACAAAQRISGKRVGKNVLFLFQPAEEIGTGARACFPVFSGKRIGRILGLHNIPGEPLGEVLITGGTFADASLGLTISMKGRQSHAAYPENGINPAFALADLVGRLPGISSAGNFSGFVLSTVVSLRVGEKNFGISAGEGELCLTLRAERTEDLGKLKDAVLSAAEKSAVSACGPERAAELEIRSSVQDEFPATENTPEDAERALRALRTDGVPVKLLEQPMRWSEDFGCFRERTRAFFFGIGSGEKQCGLHTEEYVFPKKLIPEGAAVWEKMIRIF